MRRAGPRAAALALAAPVLVAGCRGAPEPVSGGPAVEMLVRGENNLVVFYRVSEDGTIGFGGGLDARNRDVTWQGPMTPQEIERLGQLIALCGWHDAAPDSTGEPRDLVYEIEFRDPRGGRRFRVRGESPGVAPVRELLEQASRRRYDAFLKTLPQPTGPDAGAAEPPPEPPPEPPDGG